MAPTVLVVFLGAFCQCAAIGRPLNCRGSREVLVSVGDGVDAGLLSHPIEHHTGGGLPHVHGRNKSISGRYSKGTK